MAEQSADGLRCPTAEANKGHGGGPFGAEEDYKGMAEESAGTAGDAATADAAMVEVPDGMEEDPKGMAEESAGTARDAATAHGCVQW